MIRFTVNGDYFEQNLNAISYEEIAELSGRDPKSVLTVTYYQRLSKDLERNGSLIRGEVIENISEDVTMYISCMNTNSA